MFGKVAIVGPGLIGGSIGMGLRARRMAELVVGIGRRQQSLQKALEVGAVDEFTVDLSRGVCDAELVVLATPIGALPNLVPPLADALKSESLLTDVASTKAEVIEMITSALVGRPDVSYVPSHPMAGSEQRGPLAASPDLFEGSICILTPLSNTFPESKARMTAMWEALGATVVSMTPQVHDRVVARISHLVHLVAAALVAGLGESEMAFCGKGLLDTTRIASASPELWVDICRTNRHEISQAIKDYVAVLQDMAASLEDDNLERLRDLLETAKTKRDNLLTNRHGPRNA